MSDEQPTVPPTLPEETTITTPETSGLSNNTQAADRMPIEKPPAEYDTNVKTFDKDLPVSNDNTNDPKPIPKPQSSFDRLIEMDQGKKRDSQDIVSE